MLYLLWKYSVLVQHPIVRYYCSEQKILHCQEEDYFISSKLHSDFYIVLLFPLLA